jgi:hypothetical protein
MFITKILYGKGEGMLRARRSDVARLHHVGSAQETMEDALQIRPYPDQRLKSRAD